VAEEVDGLESEGAAKATPPARSKKKLIMIAGALVVLLGGGGVGGYAMLHKHKSEDASTETASAEDGDKPTYVEVPPMVVNLRSADGQQRFLKLRFVLVPAKGTTEEQVKERLPVILDSFQPFLRELRPEDLSGSAAVYRLKEELLVRAAEAFGRGRIRDILIQDLIQQ
jgi:flagellar FliL protein